MVHQRFVLQALLIIGFLLPYASAPSARYASAQSNDIERASVSSAGVQANGSSGGTDLSIAPEISSDGRYLAFSSVATNLASGGTNGLNQIYLRDTTLGATELLSSNSSGTQLTSAVRSFSLSDEGRYLAFTTAASELDVTSGSNPTQIYLKDRQTGAVILVSDPIVGIPDDEVQVTSYKSVYLSFDARYVSYVSNAENLASGDSNRLMDLFRFDRTLNSVIRVTNLTAGNNQATITSFAVSGDGKYAAYVTNDAAVVANDTNGRADLFVEEIERNLIVESIGLTSGTSTDSWGRLSFSRDGRYLVFDTTVPLDNRHQSGKRQVYSYDRSSDEIALESVDSDEAIGTDSSFEPSVTDDGRYVAFTSDAPNLVTGITGRQIYVRDRTGGKTYRSSASAAGVLGNGSSRGVAVSGNGNFIAFNSNSTNLISGDTNALGDLFRSRLLLDECPSDPDKSVPGVCGCGTADTDTDRDATLDCNESCDADPLKVLPGSCGCGIAETDTDADGALDCIESCDADPAKIEPGSCGCAVADTDRDADKTFDCVDGCADDPAKAAAGSCGCGAAELDADLDGRVDCGVVSEILTPTTALDAPPAVQVNDNDVMVIMRAFASVRGRSTTGAAVAGARRRPPLTFRYEATIAPTDGSRNDLRRRRSKRNQITFRNVPSGTYQATYKVMAFRGDRRVYSTNVSPSAPFTVGG